MKKHLKTTCAAIALLALVGGVAAAPKAGHETGVPSNHAGSPPASSNQQSAPDADRGMDRAGERRSEEGLDHFRAEEQQMEHAPDRGADHRDTHSMQPHGKDDKHPPN
jgi:hypothetical protein